MYYVRDKAVSEDMVRRYVAGEPTVSIAKSHGCTTETVLKMARAAGVARSKPISPKLAPETDAEIVRLYTVEKFNSHQVAEKLDLGHAVCIKALRRSGIEPRARVRRHKLSPGQETELAHLYTEERKTYDDLRVKFDVSNVVIGRVLKDAGVTPRTGWGRFKTAEWTDRKGRIHVFKSTWELAYAGHLDAHGIDWEYEPIKLGLKACKCYTPDFGICEAGRFVRFIEVKGWLDDRTIARIAEARVRYPSLVLEIVGPAQLAALGLVERKYLNHPMARRVNEMGESGRVIPVPPSAAVLVGRVTG